MLYTKRYLLNINTNEVHDTNNIHQDCHLPSIKDEHKKWFNTRSEAMSYPKNDGLEHNDGCAYCLSQYNHG